MIDGAGSQPVVQRVAMGAASAYLHAFCARRPAAAGLSGLILSVQRAYHLREHRCRRTFLGLLSPLPPRAPMHSDCSRRSSLCMLSSPLPPRLPLSPRPSCILFQVPPLTLFLINPPSASRVRRSSLSDPPGTVFAEGAQRGTQLHCENLRLWAPTTEETFSRISERPQGEYCGKLG